MEAIYTHRLTGETYRMSGVKGLAQAWSLARVVCDRNNWNLDMFSTDVIVRVK
jgi:hypothetical protein